jgi:hypothetical protein
MTSLSFAQSRETVIEPAAAETMTPCRASSDRVRIEPGPERRSTFGSIDRTIVQSEA